MQSTLRSRAVRLVFVLLPIAGTFFAGCGGGGGGGDSSSTPIELLDPTPGAGNQFGSSVAILANGNIAVAAPGDSSIASGNGAVHLYNPVTQTRIASIHGDAANDNLGGSGVVALPNGNFVIRSPSDDVGGIANAGSVRLVDGTTGAQIGNPIAGDDANDNLGSVGVFVLANGNFVIVSFADDVGGVVDASSVRLVDGTTGLQIGNPIAGDVAGDLLGSSGVVALPNGNFVIASPFDDVGGIVDAGSVRLVDGTTGLQIGNPVAGDVAGDRVGFGVVVLPSGNFVIASPFDDVGVVVDAGSVRLMSGTTGLQIGNPIAGDVAGDQLGSGVVALPNGNFVIRSPSDDVGVVVDAGSVRLVDGTTGLQIGNPIAGDVAGDNLGSVVAALPNGNFVIISPNDDVGGVVDAGSVRLVDGTTGLQIGNPIAGDVAGDLLGSGVVALANGNFVIRSPNDDVGVVVDAGSVRLVDGTTGLQIGNPIAGDAAGDQLGSGFGVALPNGNFVIVSPLDDVGGVVNAGSVRLMSGTTGLQIGNPIAGDVAGDQLGSDVVAALPNGNFVIVSPGDDVGGIVNAGSVRQVDGTNGLQIGDAIAGSASGDMTSAGVRVPAAGTYYVLSLPVADKNGLVDSGLVRLIAQ